jgi:hypothetical protein
MKILLKEKHIFLFPEFKGKNIVEIGVLDEQNCFKIEILIDSLTDQKSIIKNINSYSFDNFCLASFVFTNDEKNKFSKVSPYLDKNNFSGYAYRINEKTINQNVLDFYYSPILLNNIYLIRYFKFPKYKQKNEKSGYYYLISESWMLNYKKNYKYEETIEKIEKCNNPFLLTIINDEHTDKSILNKKICYLIREIYEFNNQLKNIYLDNIPYEPDYEMRKDMFSENLFYFYKNYFIL